MNAALWIAQGLLALVFLMSGGMKLMRPKEALLEMIGVLAPFSPITIKLIGLLEVLGAIGVIVPALTGILPGLTVWAAVGLALAMVGAAVAHGRRAEWRMFAVNEILFVLAAFVALGR